MDSLAFTSSAPLSNVVAQNKASHCSSQKSFFVQPSRNSTLKFNQHVTPSVSMVAAAPATSELSVPKSDFAKYKSEAAGLPTVQLSEVDMEWLHVLSEGWAAPLTGFMKEDEYLQTLHFNCLRLPNGGLSNMSVPITLACDDATKANIEGKSAVALISPAGEAVAIMRNPEVYVHNKEERIARTFGLTDERHPYGEIIYKSGDWLVGGSIEVFTEFAKNDGLDEFRLTPAELKAEYKKRNADAIFVFQLRNPIHNGHALLMKSCKEELKRRGFKNPVLVVHQIGGKVKGDDIPLDVRIKQNKAVLAEGVLDPATTILGIFPSPMLYAGPTEVQWHAKARMNAGCQYYIVGRDPAGMKHPNGEKDMFDAWHGKKVLGMAPGLEDLEILPFKVAAYDKTIGSMAFFEPERADDFLFISGTKMRKFAADGDTPPDGFMAPTAWKVIVDYYGSKK